MKAPSFPRSRVAVVFTPVEESLKFETEELRASMDIVLTTNDIAEALREAGHGTSVVRFGSDTAAYLSEIAALAPDVVFNLCECPMTQSRMEPHAAALLELLKIPYTGNGPFALSLCNSKAMTKRVLAARGIPTPAFRLFDAVPKGPIGIPFPVIVKPSREDGSAGITDKSVISTEKEARALIAHILDFYKEEALVEEFVGGREFNIGVIGNGTASDPYRVLPPAELVYTDKAFKVVSYESKWDPSHPAYKGIYPVVPAKIPASLAKRIQSVAIDCARTFGLCGYSRVDLRMNTKGKLFALEVNPNPDISPDAGMPKAAKAIGFSYPAFIDEVLRLGLALGAR